MAVDLRVPSNLRLAPDSSQIAFCVAPIGHREKDPTATIYVAASDASTLPRPITGSEHNNTLPRWSPDASSLAFLSDRPKRGELQLHVVPATGGEPLRLTNLQGGVDQPDWLPNGRAIAFTARRRALSGQKEPESDIRVASERWKPKAIATIAPTGGAPVVIGPSEGHVWTFSYSPDGARIAAVVSETESLAVAFSTSRLIVFNADGSNERDLIELAGVPGQISWSPDGRQVAVVGSQHGNRDYVNVLVVDVESGEATALDERGSTPNWASFAGDDLLVHSVHNQNTRVERTDPRGSEWEQLDLGPDAASGWIDARISIHATDNAIVFGVAQHDRPADVYVAKLGEPAIRITDLNPQLAGLPMAEMEHIIWTATDGTENHGWLLLPPDAAPNTRLPLITEVHGGPSAQWGNWFYGTWHDWAQILANAGYAVFLPNPRGSTGRGGAFTAANKYDFGGGDFDDIMTGIDMLIERGVADPDQLGICGWSFGGFMTAWAVTHTDRFKAAVAGASPTNWVSKIGTTDIRPANEWNLGAVNDEPDRPWEQSPIRYVKNAQTPTLLVQGGADVRVPPTQSWEFYNALNALGVPTDLVVYPRQGHSFHERAHMLDLLQRLTGWFATYLPIAETNQPDRQGGDA
jgi:dipeptidyl aminopeptidase/acylaminoacyl peptidase